MKLRKIVLFMLLTTIGLSNIAVSKPKATKEDIASFLKASKNNDLKSVKKIISEKEIDINTKDNYGDTALIYASLEGHEKIVSILLSKGSDPNLKSKKRKTALILASLEGYEKIVGLLLSKGADPNIKDNRGKTVLMIAKEQKHMKVVKLLIDSGAKE